MCFTKIFTLVFLFSFLNNCGPCYPPVKELSEDFFVAKWAGNPDNSFIKPFEYFYMEEFGRASKNSLEKKDEKMAKKTCMEDSTQRPKSHFVNAILEVENFSCRPSLGCDRDDRDEVRQIHKLINMQTTKVKECKPQFNFPDTPWENWRECTCIVYKYLQGGRSIISAKLRDLN